MGTHLQISITDLGARNPLLEHKSRFQSREINVRRIEVDRRRQTRTVDLSADRVYWTALRAWGLLVPCVISRSDAVRRLQAATGSSDTDDDGGRLDDAETEVFVGLPG